MRQRGRRLLDRLAAAHDLRLAPAALSCWGGAAWLVQHDSTWGLVVAVLGAVVAIVEAPRHPVLALTLCCVALVAASCAWRLVRVEQSPLAEAAEQHRSGTFVLDVRRDAVTFDRHGRTGTVVEVVVRRSSIAGVGRVGRDRATAFINGDASRLVVGRRLTAVARLAPADERHDVATLDVVRHGPITSGAPWWEVAERMRAGVRTAAEPLPDEPRALLPALVDGDDQRLTEDLEQDFQRSGLTHLTAVSGTNLTIVLGAVLVLVRGVGLRRRATWVAAVATVAAFILVARPDPSVLRAAAMGVVGVAALGFGRPGGLRALSVAAIALLFLDPWLSRSAGFVLSVVATGGILVLGPPLTRRLARWLPTPVATAVAVPVAAQLACTPTLAAISGEVSMVAVVANVVVAPAVAPATVLGLLGGLVAVAVPAAGQALAYPGGLCAAWIVEVAQRSAALDGASIAWTLPWQLLLAVVPLIALVVWVAASRPVIAVGLAAALVLVTFRPPTPGWPPDGWVMVACDVGQGDATVVNAGSGAAVLVDAGPDPPLVDRCLDRLGVKRLPLVVLTHAHADHVDGLPGARSGRRVDAVVGAGERPLLAGESFAVGSMQAEVLWPEEPARSGRSSDSDGSAVNDTSVVLRVTTQGIRLMLTGDVEPSAQDRILAEGTDLSADVLKMPHHGSARQSERFFAAVAPRVGTISAGVDNDYGHPAPAALRLLHDQRIKAFRTDLDGDIAIVVRGGQLSVVTQK